MEKYQTFAPRFLALIADSVIFLPVFFLERYFEAVGWSPAFTYSLLLVTNLAHPVYSVVMHGLYGQTLGKMITKVRVVSVSKETPITFYEAVLRDLPQFFLNFSLFFFTIPTTTKTGEMSKIIADAIPNYIYVFMVIWSIVNIVSFVVTIKHRAMHDIIAGTVVIKTT